jgi:hypothetical protein
MGFAYIKGTGERKSSTIISNQLKEHATSKTHR